MIEFFKKIASWISPLGALKEKNDLLTFKNSELETKNTEFKLEVESLKKKLEENEEEVKSLRNLLDQSKSLKPNAVNPQGVPYFSAVQRREP